MTPELIAEQIAQAIRAKEFSPGFPLVQEDLARRFNVSRNPIREALRILASEGLVTITQGSGAAVRSLSEKDLNELYDVRLVLELQIAPHVVEGATRRDIAELRELVKDMEAAESNADWMTKNFNFHVLIYSLAGRPHTESILRGLLSAVQPYAQENVERLGGREKSDLAHVDMVAAIDKGDARALASLFLEHLGDTRARLQAYLAREHEHGTVLA